MLRLLFGASDFFRRLRQLLLTIQPLYAIEKPNFQKQFHNIYSFLVQRQIKIGHRRRKQALQWFWAPVYVLAMKLDKLCLQFCTQFYKGFVWVGKPSPRKQMEPSLGNSLRQLQGRELFHCLLLDIAHHIKSRQLNMQPKT